MKSGRSNGGFSIPLFPWRYFLLKHQWRGTQTVLRVDCGKEEENEEEEDEEEERRERRRRRKGRKREEKEEGENRQL